MAGRNARTVVVGIGNLDRGDDAAGRLAVRRLRTMLPPGTLACEQDGEVTSLLAAIESAASAYLIDACVSGAPAGTVRRLDVAASPLPLDTLSLSSHGLGLAEAVELARALGLLPPCCIVYAIEASSVEPGGGVSPEVSAAVAETAERIRRELSDESLAGGRTDA